MNYNFLPKLKHVPPYRLTKAGENCFLTYSTFEEAKQRASNLAGQNIGVEYAVYDSANETPCYIRRVKFAENDPVWSAPLTTEDCFTILAAMVENAQEDANGRVLGQEYSHDRCMTEARIFLRDIREQWA